MKSPSTFLTTGSTWVVADWVFHPECWDALIEEHPP